MKNFIRYPLLSDAFNNKDINKAIKVLRSKKLTMNKVTFDFEKRFAKKIKSKYALMTNSGSSANLLAVSALLNKLSDFRITNKSEVLIPAVCWSTSLWPIIQNNLKPVFVDVNRKDFNINIDDLKRKITNKTKAIMLVHVLGTCSDMLEIMKIAKKKKIQIIEDTCESLGTKFKNRPLGTFGRFGTYSFYYSHQITSGEGGMVVCQNEKDYDILKTLRSHGWSRGTKLHSRYKKKFKNLDSRFLFIGPGYNLRPTDVQAAIANNQFKRLDKFIKIRNNNRQKIINKFHTHKKWNNQFLFVTPEKFVKPSWFGLPIIFNKGNHKNKNIFLKYLTNKGIENRPIISGNFLNQPAVKTLNLKQKAKDFKNSEYVEKKGFFIGLHTKPITNEELKFLVNTFLNF